ncbi:MAG: class I SAM-dependent methyltransferase [Planctomycetes bacterium]|nr:class I SAM-dependent methyltransferase [Planctomycetota bacterium]
MPVTSLFNRLSKRSRELKMALLREHVPLRGDERILDIGSQVDNQSRQILERVEHKSNVTAINLLGDHLDEIQQAYPGIHVMRANACELPFADQAFDLVYSNAVIEHVGDFEAQKRMADEVRRVGKRWFITTPNRWFPFEFHVRMPLISWLPPRMMHKAARVWGYNHMQRRYQSGCDYSDVQLMTASQLQRAFPDSRILKPRVTVWPETLVVVGPV